MVNKNKKLKFAVLAADTALFIFDQKELWVRLIRVNRPPYFTNCRGLPGGLIDPKETADEAAKRHLWEKGGVKNTNFLDQLYTFSALNRDPRGRVIAVAYLGLGYKKHILIAENNDKEFNAQWFSVNRLPKLAYDHKEIIRVAVERIRAKLGYTNIASVLLPDEFTLGELQVLYEKILNHKLDKRNFRKKILKLKLLIATARQKRGIPSRPAVLYKFRDRKIKIVEIL